ncbi:NHL repeat-containing protein [Paenibacillus sp. P25]|nr:NHL repeat-containing protein [Paenibacillus sp. P25]
MKIRYGWWRSLLSLLLLCAALPPAFSSAAVKYSTFTKDSYSNLVWLQPAYYPIGVIGEDLYAADPGNPQAKTKSPMKNPKDIFVDPKGEIYIADTGNNRVVHMTDQGALIRYLTVPESPLNKPEGIFVTKEGDIYIADTGNKRVVKLDPGGKLQREFKRPDTRYIPESFVFDPAKVMVDERGFLFIAVHGGYEGLVLLDPNGKFQGFFGANKTVLSALDALKRWLYTKEMYANEVAKRPETINSVATDKNGYIYTVSGGTAKTDQLKKLNIKGENLLRGSPEIVRRIPCRRYPGGSAEGGGESSAADRCGRGSKRQHDRSRPAVQVYKPLRRFRQPAVLLGRGFVRRLLTGGAAQEPCSGRREREERALRSG